MSAVIVSQNMTTESNLILECCNALNSLAKGNAVDMLWVSAHNGIQSNEMAVAIEVSSIDLEAAVGISYS